MKRLLSLIATAIVSGAAVAQSFNVEERGVSYNFALPKVGNVTFGANTFSLGGITFDQRDGIQLQYAETEPLADNEVRVAYNGPTAQVEIAANLKGQVSASVSGAHVTLLQAPDVANEITYTLSGQTDNGSLYMDGKFKATFVLAGLTLHNPDSAAINIQDGKRIAIELAAGTENSLSDGIRAADDGSDAHNACLYVDGHTELSGSGALTITGNVKHAFTSDEYCIVKKTAGAITVATAVGDGFHIGQYYEQRGGTVTISCNGDGVDVGAKKDPATEKNGQCFVSDGLLTITTTGDATKGIKSDASMEISGGTIDIRATGNAYYDTTERDISSAAAIKPGTTFTMTGGSVNALATGSGGKVLNAGGAVTFDGGCFSGASCGAVFVNGADDSKPQGVKSDGNITINSGEVYIAASKDKGTAFKTDFTFAINGGTVMGIGGKSTSASAASKQASRKYTGVKVTGGTTVSYDGVSYTVPAEYANSSAYVIVSRPGL